MTKNLKNYDLNEIKKRASRLATLENLSAWDYWGRDAAEYADDVVYWEKDPNVSRSLEKYKKWLVTANNRFIKVLLRMRETSGNWHKISEPQRIEAIKALCDIYTNGIRFSDACPDSLKQLFAPTHSLEKEKADA